MKRLFLPGCFVFFAGLLPIRADNPIVTDVFTADPTAIVHDGTVYLYTGHDESPEINPRYVMNNWLCFSSTDMAHWTACGSPVSLKDFAWAKSDAWACEVRERDGKFYFYAPMRERDGPGFGIGVAVSDSPTGPFKDALGAPLIPYAMLSSPPHPWSNIDPAVFVDDDGQAYIYWGNTKGYWAKLKPDMTELDGGVNEVAISGGGPSYTEAPWVHKHNGLYYFSYAAGFPEVTAYATGPSATGPWTYQGIVAEKAKNSDTIHQAIIEFKGQSYFIYHNGMNQPAGGSFRRSVCVDYLYYHADGTIKEVVQTTEGTSVPPAP
jgi:beta-xylosidase